MVHHSASLRQEPGGDALQEAVVSADVEALPSRLRALHRYALALTADPSGVQESDVRLLLDAGLSARDVIDANQVVSYFNYVNRVANGLGVQLEAHWSDEPREAPE